MINKTRSKITNLNEKEILEIQQGLKDIKKGKVYSINSIARKLGVTLK